MAKKILIVEDYDDTRSFMKLLIESCGYQVLEAKDGRQAIEIVYHEQPDLILIDIAMPNVDGLTATRIIRGFDKTANLPIIAFTAYEKSLHREALSAGCNDLIDKSMNFEEITSVLNKYLAS